MIQCLRHFYRSLRHHFPYWFMANDLVLGCPASSDLMNILFEPFHFHWWAAAQDKGGCVGDWRVASASFDDAVTLIAIYQL